MIKNDKPILLPNTIINFISNYGEKALLIYIYLEQHRTYRNKAYISVANCITECGYKLPTKENATVKEFKDTLQKMINDGVIKTNTNKFKLNDLIVCDLDEVDGNFFVLEQHQYDWIMNSKTKSKRINLLKLFCVIKSKIATRHKDEDIYDGVYEVAFPSYKNINQLSGISESNIKKYINELVDLKLIKYDNLGQIYNTFTGETKKCNNTYAIYKSGWEEELEGSMRLYKQKLKEQGWIVIKKKNT